MIVKALKIQDKKNIQIEYLTFQMESFKTAFRPLYNKREQ